MFKHLIKTGQTWLRRKQNRVLGQTGQETNLTITVLNKMPRKKKEVKKPETKKERMARQKGQAK